MNSLAVKNKSLVGINRIKGVNPSYVQPKPGIDELVQQKEAAKDTGVDLDAGETYMGFSRKQFWTLLGIIAIAAIVGYALIKYKVIKI